MPRTERISAEAVTVGDRVRWRGSEAWRTVIYAAHRTALTFLRGDGEPAIWFVPNSAPIEREI